ncbi:MAG: UDP-N-acetylmuramoyl-L-alanine--D-glutamate ligase [Eubacteriales bacterium]|nr:UDP-N-acetylmuramoyl-L-alanine--D-glutamate ligase [Eubacteriales bacterium]
MNIRTNEDNIKNKKVLVVGFGRSGKAAAEELLRRGAAVTIQDNKKESDFDANMLTYFRDLGASFCLDRTPTAEEPFNQVILSPGVSPELPFVQELEKHGAEITGELEIAYRISKGNFVAITGTNGKTTTTTLVSEIFRNSGRTTFTVGNIGVAVIQDAAKAKENDWLITETSSFQLETTKYFRPVISACLNVTPDHLNRHHTFENYAAQKAKIFRNQSAENYFITNYEDETCRKMAEHCAAKVVWFSSRRELPQGAFQRDGRLILRKPDGEEIDFVGVDELKIIGDHNVQNALAALAIADAAGIGTDVIRKTLREFAGVEHRLEFTAEINGVRYFNDSKGTNTDAAETAIRAIGENILLIAGGDAKGQDFTEFVKSFPEHVKKLFFLGRDEHYIKEAAQKIGFTYITECRDMEECVRKCFEMAEPGDTVLLSPACASWDMYDNYEQRGRHFKDCVMQLER